MRKENMIYVERLARKKKKGKQEKKDHRWRSDGRPGSSSSDDPMHRRRAFTFVLFGDDDKIR